MPACASPLIAHREFFRGAALVIRRADDQVEYWKMVFMVKSPLYLALCPLRPTEEWQACSALLEPRDMIYSFKCNFGDCYSAADVDVGATDQLSILWRLQHNGGIHVSSGSVPAGLDWLLSGVAQKSENSCEQKDVQEPAKKAAREFDEVLQELPWLQHLDERQGYRMKTSSACSQGRAPTTPESRGACLLMRMC